MKGNARAWEKDHGFDEKGYQRNEACLAIAYCPKCDGEVELVAGTHVWHEAGGRWKHAEYGPAVGWCCGLAIIDEFDGCVCLDLNHHHGEVECPGCEDCENDEDAGYDDNDYPDEV